MYRVVAVVIAALMLSACSGGSHQDLHAYIAEVKARPKGSIEPVPAFTPYEAFSYSAIRLRSPFERPVPVLEQVRVVEGRKVEPDFDREKELLENYNIASLTMVGTLTKGGTLWALINDGEGGVHPVTKGNYLGKNHGRIVEAGPSGIDLIEIVSDGRGGWIERPRTIPLTEKE